PARSSRQGSPAAHRGLLNSSQGGQGGCTSSSLGRARQEDACSLLALSLLFRGRRGEQFSCQRESRSPSASQVLAGKALLLLSCRRGPGAASANRTGHCPELATQARGQPQPS